MAGTEELIPGRSGQPEAAVHLPRSRPSLGARLRRHRFGPGAVIALVALVGLAAWLVVESRSGSSSTSASSKPVALSAAGLRTLAGALGQPVYWIGEKPGTTYELAQTSGHFLLRYLPQGVEAGDAQRYLTIGTYPMQNAYDVIKATSPAAGTVVATPGAGIAVISKQHPTSVYVTYPGWGAQIEVYDPSAARARRVALSGLLQPVIGGASVRAAGPKAVSRDGLASLAASLGHPIYWVGPRAKTTYELTQTPEGRTFIRYLPKGVRVGGKRPFLTVGTYPLAGAYAVTQALSKSPDNVTIRLPGGGIAAYAKKSPTNVHLAYPGIDVQVEVYDPSASVPRKLVADGKVVPVG